MAHTRRQSHLNPEQLKAMRKEVGRNQRDFWSMFGVSQPQGSRFEKNLTLSVPVAMLIWLHAQQKLSDRDLSEALSALTLSAPCVEATELMAA